MVPAAAVEHRILRIGSVGLGMLEGRGAEVARGTVAAVHDRSLYIESNGRFLCVGAPGIGDGPLTAVAAGGAFAALRAASRAGQAVTMRAGRVDAGGWRLDAGTAEVWRPAPWPARVTVAAILSAVAVAMDAGWRDPRSDGLAKVSLGVAEAALGGTRKEPPLAGLEERRGPRADLGDCGGLVQQVAAPRLRALWQWIGEAVETGVQMPPPTDLLGLGPGLTPSGDDVLCGALLALHGWGAGAVVEALGDAVVRDARVATSPLSAAYLEAAADGLGSRALHHLVGSLIAGDVAAIEADIAVLGRIGHSSGRDAMGGVLIAISAAATGQGGRSRRSPSPAST